MTKYDAYDHRARYKKPEKPHAIWRGIGCLILVIVPITSYAAGRITIDYGLNHAWPIPLQLLGYPSLPDFFYDVPALIMIFGPITRWPNFYAYLATTLLYIMAIGGSLTVIYAVLYRFVGPPSMGPQDVPPPRGTKHKPYKR